MKKIAELTMIEILTVLYLVEQNKQNKEGKITDPKEIQSLTISYNP
jgi:hypothetical protein